MFGHVRAFLSGLLGAKPRVIFSASHFSVVLASEAWTKQSISNTMPYLLCTNILHVPGASMAPMPKFDYLDHSAFCRAAPIAAVFLGDLPQFAARLRWICTESHKVFVAQKTTDLG